MGFDHDVPVFHGAYVTADSGTGLVHIAPGHGVEDFELAHIEHGVEVPQIVQGDGTYYDHVPLFAGAIGLYKRRQRGHGAGPNFQGP